MFFIATLLLVVLGRVLGQEWVNSSYGRIPDYAFKAGTDEDNSALYVCKAVFQDETCAGKVNANLGHCLIPYYKEEHVMPTYEVLTSPPWEDYTLEWSEEDYSNGYVPENTVKTDSAGIYVGRYNHNDHYIPGKIIPKSKSLFYGYNDEEMQVHDYKVLLKTSRSVDHYNLHNVLYNLSGVSYDLSHKQVTLSQKTVTNDSPYDTTSLLSMTFTDSKTGKWSQMNGFEVHGGIKMSVAAEIPYFGCASAEVEFGNSQYSSYIHGGSYETSETTTRELTVNLPAYSNVTVSMLAKKRTGSIPYTGTLRVVFTNRQYYDQAGVQGLYIGAHYTSFDSSIKTSPLTTDGNEGIKPVPACWLWMAILFLSFKLYE